MIKRNELQEFIKNGGATLAKNGGAVAFKTGYQVSKKDYFVIDAHDVNKVLKAVNGLLECCEASEFVGLWVDSGMVYIDLSERVERLSDAIRCGVERFQKSIFDWCCGRCISLE